MKRRYFILAIYCFFPLLAAAQKPAPDTLLNREAERVVDSLIQLPVKNIIYYYNTDIINRQLIIWESENKTRGVYIEMDAQQNPHYCAVKKKLLTRTHVFAYYSACLMRLDDTLTGTATPEIYFNMALAARNGSVMRNYYFNNVQLLSNYPHPVVKLLIRLEALLRNNIELLPKE